MGLKTVILCEGVHDLSLISILLEMAGRTVSTKNWEEIQRFVVANRNVDLVSGFEKRMGINFGQIDDYSPIHGETRVISNFKNQRRGNFSFLVKQDNNIDTCIKSFWKLYRADPQGYSLKMVIDSDGENGIRKVRRFMNNYLNKDVLIVGNEPNILNFKGGENKPAVFLYPITDSAPLGKLTDLVSKAGCGNLAEYRDSAKRKEMIMQYLDTHPPWIEDLKNFLLG